MRSNAVYPSLSLGKTFVSMTILPLLSRLTSSAEPSGLGQVQWPPDHLLGEVSFSR